MVMILWWLPPLIVLVALGVWALTYVRRRAETRPPVLVANSEYLDSLPSYVRAQKRSKVLRLLVLAFAVLGVLGSAFLSGRIATERIESPSFASRDIVLCLDVSGSMYEYDTEILQTFAGMVEEFEGERIGLSIFNSTSRTVFPLTNDYVLAQRELLEGAEAIDYDEFGVVYGTKQYTPEEEAAYYRFVEGTRGVPDQASLVPDGLASCGLLFDGAEEDRARTVIFATDNEVNGIPIYTLDEAVSALAEEDITIFALYPGAYECGAVCEENLRTAVEGAGGTFYYANDPDAVPSIIAAVERQQAAMAGETPRVIRTDHPLSMFLVALAAVYGTVVAGWWWSRR